MRFVAAGLILSLSGYSHGFTILNEPSKTRLLLEAKKGGGGGFGGGFGAAAKQKKGKKKKVKRRPSLADALADAPRKSRSENQPFVKSEQEELLESLSRAAASTAIGQAVASSPLHGTGEADPFYELMPSLISSRFPNVSDSQLQRVAGMIRHALNPDLPLEEQIINDPHRPEDAIHAYMPGLGPTKAFYEPNEHPLCQKLSDNYDTIKAEYHALLQDIEDGGKDRFQSVTSMNYESGWKTLVLFYNGHRIEGFPYHLCPRTTELLESVPLAGRIAGFNRQQPMTGIPLHTDGNNMWLTCQMGVNVPEGTSCCVCVWPKCLQKICH